MSDEHNHNKDNKIKSNNQDDDDDDDDNDDDKISERVGKPPPEQTTTTKLRVLEFFSGIGGMRCALERALNGAEDDMNSNGNDNGNDTNDNDPSPHGDYEQQQHSVVAETTPTQNPTNRPRRRRRMELASCHAYEIHRPANQVYRQNFVLGDSHETTRTTTTTTTTTHAVHTKLVEQLTLRDVGNSDLWTLSPPCQPFTNTRFAKQRDLDDKRNKGLLALLTLLEQLTKVHETRTQDQKDEESGTTTKTKTNNGSSVDPSLVFLSENKNHHHNPRAGAFETGHPPEWILLENVQGFVSSQVRQVLLATLHRCGYSWQEYLLSPIQIGIPNHRKRYYILCEASDRFFVRQPLPTQEQQQLPPSNPIWPQTNNDDQPPSSTPKPYTRESNLSTVFPELQRNKVHPSTTTIESYLDNDHDVDWDVYGLTHEVLAQPWAHDLPLVGPHDTHSHCFTAFYSRQLHKSTGSLLLIHHPTILSVAEAASSSSSLASTTTTTTTTGLDRSDMTQYVGMIRKFTPTELLRLFGFPSTFSLDMVHDDDEEEQDEEEKHDDSDKRDKKNLRRLQAKYKLIGNSINVTVVSILLEYLLFCSKV
ncbi:hypothetical protein ACA910_008113 [Epithemia clementina (nom. ined.)]